MNHDQFCRLFDKSEQHGRLFIRPMPHHELIIYVLDAEIIIHPTHGNLLDENPDYGVIVYNKSNSLSLGHHWLHDGSWKQDFFDICHKKLKLGRAVNASNKARDKLILDSYELERIQS